MDETIKIQKWQLKPKSLIQQEGEAHHEDTEKADIELRKQQLANELAKYGLIFCEKCPICKRYIPIKRFQKHMEKHR